MAKCLVVKLSESINDDSLMKFGSFRIKCNVLEGEERTSTYVLIKTNEKTTVKVDNVELNANTTFPLYISDYGIGEHIVEVKNKYAITEIALGKWLMITPSLPCPEELFMCDSLTICSNGFLMDIADFAYLKRTNIEIRVKGTYGKVEDYTQRMRDYGVPDGEIQMGNWSLGAATIGGVQATMPKDNTFVGWDKKYEWTMSKNVVDGEFTTPHTIWVNSKMPQSEIDKRTAEDGVWYGATVVKKGI